MVLTGYVYHICDDYFTLVSDPKLMQNKEREQYRPTYYCKQDPSTGLLWMIPMSSKYSKYKGHHDDKIAKHGTCDTIVLGKYDGQNAAFLLQNMFPVIDKYINHIHTRNNNPVPVPHAIIIEIDQKFDKVMILVANGYPVVFPNIKRLEKLMIEELKKDAIKLVV